MKKGLCKIIVLLGILLLSCIHVSAQRYHQTISMNKEGLNTKNIQRAIDRMAAKGGGTLVIPKGVWRTGRIELKSGVNLDIPEGAELHFSGEVKDYQPAVFTRNEGVEMMSLGACIYANGADNISITGKGHLVGPGHGCEIDSLEKNDNFLDGIKVEVPVNERLFDGRQGRRFFRPVFIGLMNCRNILIEDISISKGIFWNIVPEYCDSVTIRRVTIDSKGTPRGDAIDIESTRNVLIEYCRVTTTDDAYTLKAGRGEDGLRVNRPTENVIIRHCYANSSAGGVCIGSETAGGIRNVYVSDCTFEDTKNGVYIKTRRPRGGGGSGFTFERIRMVRPRTAFFWDMLGSPQWVGALAERLPNRDITPLTPEFRDIHFKDISVEDCGQLIHAKGLPERPITDVSFENIKAEGSRLINAADLQATFENVRFNGLEINWR